MTRRSGRIAAAALFAVAGLAGCADDAPPPAAKPRLASFVETLDGEEIFDIIVWKSIKLQEQAFVLSAEEQVEVLATDQTTDPETERLVQVFRVKHAKGEGWVEAHFVRR